MEKGREIINELFKEFKRQNWLSMLSLLLLFLKMYVFYITWPQTQNHSNKHWSVPALEEKLALLDLLRDGVFLYNMAPFYGILKGNFDYTWLLTHLQYNTYRDSTFLLLHIVIHFIFYLSWMSIFTFSLFFHIRSVCDSTCFLGGLFSSYFVVLFFQNMS